MPSTASTNQKLTLSARRCIGARERCACATSCTICASTVSEPTLSARMTSAPVPFIVAPITLSPGRLLDRDRLAGQHRLVDARAALQHLAVDRHLLARAHAQAVADVHVRQRNVLFGAVGAQTPRGLRREAEQRLERRRGARARLQFQHLAEQRQRDDDRGRLEVDADAPVLAERVREQVRAPRSRRRCRRTRRRRRCRSASTCSGCDSRSTAPSARRTASRPTARPAR